MSSSADAWIRVQANRYQPACVVRDVRLADRMSWPSVGRLRCPPPVSTFRRADAFSSIDILPPSGATEKLC